jgi:hypothetical protein
LFQGGTTGFQTPVLVNLLPEFISLILVGSHQGGCPVIPTSYGLRKHILFGDRIIDHIGADVGRIIQVEW